MSACRPSPGAPVRRSRARNASRSTSISTAQGSRSNGQSIRDGDPFVFDNDSSGGSPGSADIDGRYRDSGRKLEVGLQLHLTSLDGTPWVCGDLPRVTTPPVDRTVYGKPHHDHPSVDLPVVKNTPAYAVKAGTVSYVGNDCGIAIQINGYDGATYRYCHLTTRLVPSGAVVLAGDEIGLSGDTIAGGAKESGAFHLHVQITVNGPRDLRCPQTMLQAIWDGVTPPDAASLPGTGCYYASKPKVQLNKVSFNVIDGEPNYPILWSSTLKWRRRHVDQDAAHE